MVNIQLLLREFIPNPRRSAPLRRSFTLFHLPGRKTGQNFHLLAIYHDATLHWACIYDGNAHHPPSLLAYYAAILVVWGT